jgi:hypothetical protein
MSGTPGKAVPKPTLPVIAPVNDGRFPQELFEIIQLPPNAHPFEYENLWETDLCDFFEDFDECKPFFVSPTPPSLKFWIIFFSWSKKVCFAHCCYYCYLYGIFKAMDENLFSYSNSFIKI